MLNIAESPFRFRSSFIILRSALFFATNHLPLRLCKMSWTKEKAMARIREVGLIPIVRTPSSEDAVRAAEAILAAGIGIAEITMTVPDALRVLERVAKDFGDRVLLGAGTVLDAKSC